MEKIILFDMDGVIVDSIPLHRKIEKEMFKKLGIKISDDEHYSFAGKTSLYIWTELKKTFNLSQTPSELTCMKDDLFHDHLLTHNDFKAIPGAIKLIKLLFNNNIRMALASSSGIREIKTILKSLKINQFFEHIVSGEDVKQGKPAPDIFLKAVELMGAKTSECIVIEDSMNGVLASKAAGIKCIGLNNSGMSDQDLSCADRIVFSLDEIDIESILKM